ncbi:YfbM family protein [Bacillus badius]|uniref:YfbM family protein n=1 Tax=Bacillus badius TaxID=1455 RepID=UPI002E242352|nr:YfbM family protein [Bacillus badius]
MGMIASYHRISTEQLEHLIAQPEAVEIFLYETEEVSEREVDIDKAWHGIYFLLTGEGELGAANSLAGDAILGGKPLGEDLGMGPCRYLSAAGVKEIADTLNSISASSLSARFDAKAFNEAEIYPMYSEWTEADKAYLLDNYEELVRYFAEAARHEEGMLLLIQ